MTAEFRKKFVAHIATLGVIMTLVEVSVYITFFHHIASHNKNIASTVVQPGIIKQRNQANAITMFGQLLAWVMEVWYVFFIACLSAYYDIDTLREVASLLKTLEFFLIPLVEVHTSKPISNIIEQYPTKCNWGHQLKGGCTGPGHGLLRLVRQENSNGASKRPIFHLR